VGKKLAMSMYARLLGIAVVVAGFGLPETIPADDVWKGSWKFEIDRQDQPSLGYYDRRGKTVFRIGCAAHFDMRAVYPGAPKKNDTKVSITISNDKTQMDFAGVLDADYDYGPPRVTNFDQLDLGYARDDPGALSRQVARAGRSLVRSSGFRPSRLRSRPKVRAMTCRRSTPRGGARASRKSVDARTAT
jgi:hypothetical protein